MWKVLGRIGTALAASAAVVITAVPANAASYTAFAFSQSGSQPTIYDFINSATTSLDMTMYELEDTTAVNDLIALKNKGATVRVILDRQHQSANSSAYNALTSAGVGFLQI
ncbi:MAG: phospholipase D-like domain-containing protein [Actinoallomurus sp.]